LVSYVDFMAHVIFLSYSTKDKDAAEAVCAALEGRGIGVWMAPRDILPGLSWASAIVDGIDSARAAVLVFSSAANNSQQIEREVQHAIDKGLTVVPFRIEDVKPREALAYCIGAVQWLDALAPPMEAHYDQLSKVVRQIASLPPPSPLPSPPPGESRPAPTPDRSPKPEPTHSPPPSSPSRKWLPIMAAAAGLLVVFGFFAARYVQSPPVVDTVIRTPPAEQPTPPVKPGGNGTAASNTQPSNTNSGFAIVFGADVTPEAAMDEIRKAKRPPINAHPVLYKKGKYWNSVTNLKMRSEADAQLSNFKAIWPTAFIVDLSSWCPTPRSISSETPEMAEQLDCGS
jgi:hypothetical protein